MGRVLRNKVKSVGSIPKKSMNLKKKRQSRKRQSKSKAVSNNNSIEEVVPTESIDEIYKPSTSLNSTIEVIEIDDSLHPTDKLEDTKTASSRFTAVNNYDIIDITDTTSEDDKYERCQIETSKVTVKDIKDDEIIDITDTTIEDDKYERCKIETSKVTSKVTVKDIKDDEIIDITDNTVVDSELETSQSTDSTSLKETRSCYDDVQIISHTTYAQNNTIDIITISDDTDEENIPHQSKICINKQKTVEKPIKQRLGLPSHSTNLSVKKYISPLPSRKQKFNDYLSQDFGPFVIDKTRINQHSQNLNKYKPKGGPYQKNPNPSTKTVTEHHRNLRPIIIDGLNIGHAHGHGIFSAKGISLCIRFFADRGHKKIIAFIPQHRQGPPGSKSNEILNDLMKRGHICYTPSRKVQNERMTCYDDRIILNYAHKCNGVVVSNDNYRDLYGESEEFKEIIENRQVMVTFVRDEIIVPDDQYNRISEIRSLSDILCFPE